MGYYICSGIDPATVSHVKYKVHGIVEISSIILNILIYARIKIYQNPKILPFSLKTNQPVLKKCLFLQVSISPTFYQQLFRTKVKQSAKLVSTCSLGLNVFVARKLGRKAVGKMLVKLTPGCGVAILGWRSSCHGQLGTYSLSDGDSCAHQ
jgi:hypothetical protein